MQGEKTLKAAPCAHLQRSSCEGFDRKLRRNAPSQHAPGPQRPGIRTAPMTDQQARNICFHLNA
ncbi:hypothetical protein CK626_02865 [Vandammella animalimorsus]|nr:hypothetical protein CK626_02865 [Vandammella animalimorsus]